MSIVCGSLINPYNICCHNHGDQELEEEEFALCIECGNAIEKCVCVCPYCGERDKCECALFEAATGG
ncbi:hypothetical protein DSQ19_02160 [Candidatus Nitrosotenuis sp. DW1]|nr:hypothetical protein DSQ19_02160 [Candidatus Nitrosotenuis sp. DW1]